jgi:hypothetical protein
MRLQGYATILTLTLLAAAFGGCSEARELSTSGQAASFVVGVAGGESPEGWKLASKPTAKAAEAWADRDIIGDIGRRLRSEGSSWACEFAHKSVGLGSIGYFDENDSPIVTREAANLGINSNLISALLHDVVTLHYREFVLVTTSICGPYKS